MAATAPPGLASPPMTRICRYAFNARSFRTEHLPFSGARSRSRVSGHHPPL